MSYWIPHRKEPNMPKQKLALILDRCPIHNVYSLILVETDAAKRIELTPPHVCPSPRVLVKTWYIDVKN